MAIPPVPMNPAQIAAAATNATLAPPEPAAPAAPPEPAPSATPEPAAPPAPVTHPWDADVQAAFTDPAQATAVSEFMAAKYSPYVQGLEQERADLRQQALTHQQLQEAPVETLIEVISELYPDASQAEVMTFLESLSGVAETPPATPTEAKLSPEQQQAIEWAQNQRAEAEQQAALSSYLEEAKPHLEANKDIPEPVFHRYVATTGGNFDNAIARYRAENPAPAAPPAPPAPPVIGGTPSAGNPSTNYGDDLDRAIGDMWSAMGSR